MVEASRVLVVDDDPSMRDLLALRLSQRGLEPVMRSTATEAIDCVDEIAPDLVLTDVRMEGMDGISFCERLVLRRPDIPVIVMTAHMNVDAAIGALRARAFDFLAKPIDTDTLYAAVDSALRFRAARANVVRLDAPGVVPPHDDVVGKSRPMQELFDLVNRVAGADTTVLIMGESGSGKELVARAIHQGSRRKARPFITVNCSAVPESLLESELFGHVKGAFTDARADRRGLFEQAHGGTLFLDEIGEIPLHVQPKLLRAIQERVVRPIGGSREINTDVRLVAATHQDLHARVRSGQFREDLFYRLDVVELKVPALRERGTDVLLCAQHFVDRFARATGRDVVGLTPEASERLLAYNWPGNVRELQNVIERAVLLTRHERITVDDFPDVVQKSQPTARKADADAPLLSLDEIERTHIARVLSATNGNKTLAAQILGIDRRTLYRKGDRASRD